MSNLKTPGYIEGRSYCVVLYTPGVYQSDTLVLLVNNLPSISLFAF